MTDLRDPVNGCPWDKQQTFESIAPYTIEEAYEVEDSIIQGDMEAFKEELGDLLFQVVFQSQIAKEKELFDFNQVLVGLIEKMVSRHPHVFGDEKIDSIEKQNERWQELKQAEKKSKIKQRCLDGVLSNLPPINRAIKLQKKAADCGFDWPDISGVVEKIEEEMLEVKHEIKQGNHDLLAEELGDLLFSCINLIRFADLDVNIVLGKANKKFEGRFRKMEEKVLSAGKKVQDMDLSDLEDIWQSVK